MTKILKFPDLHLRALRVRASWRHDISIRITDRFRPEEARWFTQFAIQRAAGFNALKGFTDPAAVAGRWHHFEVGRTFRIRRLLRDVEPLIIDRRLVVEVDGKRVRLGFGGNRAAQGLTQGSVSQELDPLDLPAVLPPTENPAVSGGASSSLFSRYCLIAG